MKTFKLIISGLLLSASITTLAMAQGTQANAQQPKLVRAANGLEVSDASSVPVSIADLTDREAKIGLSHGTIEARVNAVLRNNGLKPVESIPYVTDHTYSIAVIVSGSSFQILASFARAVTYNDGIRDRHFGGAMTWSQMYSGGWNRPPTGHDEDAVDSILKKISEFTEEFANEFLKANQNNTA